MYLEGDRIITSASDLSAASYCEFAFLRGFDAKLGRISGVPHTEDAMLIRTGLLGDAHEARVLERYQAEFGDGVALIERPNLREPGALTNATELTKAAFDAQHPVVFQATFAGPADPFAAADSHTHNTSDPRINRPDPAIDFIGFADFIVRMPDGAYRVQDTKLARSARVTALLQLAAYAERLTLLGVPLDPEVELLLGDGSVSVHRLSDIDPVFRLRRARLLTIIREHFHDSEAVVWGDARFVACGRCEVCEAEVLAARDLLLVAGLRTTQRTKLLDAGITSIDQLAASTQPVAGIAESVLTALRAQAALQLKSESGYEVGDGAGAIENPVQFEVYDPNALAIIPEPNDGDVFFDFEGDPLYTEGDGHSWGLDYLFGLVEHDGTFRAWWAHNFAEEREALLDFLSYIATRRAAFPDLHIYHYAAYERTHLLSLAARHGVGEAEVDQLLREHALVDLYPVVRKSLRVGSRSYSLKKLEPLYMGHDVRAGEVTTAGDSIDEYAKARELIDAGDSIEGQHLLDEIANYNAYDCRSTLELRNWLLSLADTAGVSPLVPTDDDDPRVVEPSPVALALTQHAGDPLDAFRTDDERAAGLAAAAIDYHRREHKSFWWGHFSRLVEPIDEWAETRDVLRIETARVHEDWHQNTPRQSPRRILLLRGELAPGSRISPSDRSGPYLLYEYPGPYPAPRADPGARSARPVQVLEAHDDGSLLVLEICPKGVEPHNHLPSALAPSAPPSAGSQEAAITDWATEIADQWGIWPENAMVDIVRRSAPRTLSGAGLAIPAEIVDGSGLREPDRISAVVASILDLDSSYLAIQGPPGTGKTYLASHVIKALVERHHYKIGVVAQSHAVVENVLDKVVSAGLDPELVGKVPRSGAETDDVAFTALPANGQLLFAAEHADTGFVVGGTAWDLSNPARVPRLSLDLLVVDEAGQFSLASTIAASVSARNVVLLGDPQQLPQVSQGTHPEPVDTSALGWVAEGHDVLPADRGYFLAESRRMHPAVSTPVSALSYEGALHSHPLAAHRHLDGVDPGVHPRPIRHVGNAIESLQEAEEVVRLVQSLLGTGWSESADAPPRELGQHDFIVVTPYNAQLSRVRESLDTAGLAEVRVGTVDKFQGAEAVISIVSLAASDAVEVPRGLDFLLMKNRLNVAISRAQWASFLIYSPGLLDALPNTPAGVAQLSAFARLVGH